MKPLKITNNQKENIGKLIKQYYKGDYDRMSNITHIKQFDVYERGIVWDFVGWYYGEPDENSYHRYAYYEDPIVRYCDYTIPE